MDASNYFPRTVVELNRGATAAELSRKLEEIVAAVRETGRPASISLTLKVAPMQGADDVLTISDEIKVKMPASPKSATVFFCDEENRLHRNDPRQMELALKVVDIELDKQNLKEVNG